MSRSLSLLRRGLLGVAFVGSLGLGATQAFGSPDQARISSCPATGDDYAYAYCNYSLKCGPTGGGYCSAQGQCKCGPLP